MPKENASKRKPNRTVKKIHTTIPEVEYLEGVNHELKIRLQNVLAQNVDILFEALEAKKRGWERGLAEGIVYSTIFWVGFLLVII